MKEEKTYYSISQINEYIKVLFDNTITLKGIHLKGEISNFKGANKSGHLYFSLKDEKSSISAVLFKYDALGLTFTPKNGDEVIVEGTITSYPPSGTYQIICKHIYLFGKGDLLLKKEELKKSLESRGIFNENHKLEIPRFPKKITIITGKNSAAAVDFEYNLKRRFPLVDVNIIYSLVQGQGASEDLIKNIDKAENENPDIIIIGRGGGSSEDLDAFDDEELVLRIYDCKIPIISAVGHQINLTLCDLVADSHASTPTGAAEIAVPDINDIEADLENYSNVSLTLIRTLILKKENKLNILRSNPRLSSQGSLIDSHINKIENYKVQSLNSMLNIINKKKHKLELLSANIELSNPTNILEKGYSIVFDKDGKVIKNANLLNNDDLLKIKFSEGAVEAKVTKKE